MMRLLRALLLSLLCLMLFIVAGCISNPPTQMERWWMLWSRRVIDEDTASPWNLVDAYESHEWCMANAKGKAQGMGAAMDAVKNTGIETAYSYGTLMHEQSSWKWQFRERGALVSLQYACWPDTIDPRGPKGK